MQDSILVRALKGERGDRVPVWFMRQAGRFLPEYREVRKQHSMLDVIRTPALAAKVTLQPLERFDLDAGIIFADILNPLMGMGVELDFVAGEGPRIFNPVRDEGDVAKLIVPPVEENVGYTLEAIEMVSSTLRPRGIPLLGFAGAPFTLSAYLVEGGGFSQPQLTKRFMLEKPEAWDALQEKLREMVSAYLVAQARAGAAAVQIFDSWVGHLGPAEFERFVFPHLSSLIGRVRSQAGVPVIYFSTASTALFGQIGRLGADAIGVDWRQSLSAASRSLACNVLQGNLDPALLLGPRAYLEEAAENVLREGAKLRSHVFNLGHGILPETPIENVEALLRIVKGWRR